jgi:hypothetical protein
MKFVLKILLINFLALGAVASASLTPPIDPRVPRIDSPSNPPEKLDVDKNFEPIIHCPILNTMLMDESRFGLFLMDRAEACGPKTKFECRSKYLISSLHFMMFQGMKSIHAKECNSL